MNPFKFEITQDMVDQMPADQRGTWQQLLDGQREHAARIEALAADRDFVKALWLVESQDRADRIVAWDEQYAFTDAEAEAIVRDSWSTTEAWSADPRLRDGMYGLLKRVAPVVVVNEDNPRPLPQQPRFQVYRGNLGETPGPHIASWTLDPLIAERFALMANSPRGWFLGMSTPDEPGTPTVWRATAFHADVLGYFDDRDEREVVIEGAKLMEVHAHRAVVAGAPYGLGEVAGSVEGGVR